MVTPLATNEPMEEGFSGCQEKPVAVKMAAGKQGILQHPNSPGRPPQDGNGCRPGPRDGRPAAPALPGLRLGRREVGRDLGLEPASPDPGRAPPYEPPRAPVGTWSPDRPRPWKR